VSVRIAVLTCLSVALAAAQDQPPRPTFRAEANYVRVDVYPTKDGAPVLDLSKDDFAILEERAPQKIEQFERIVIRAAGPQESRIEPNSTRDMRSMLENDRARIFVLFLDTYHVEVSASHNIRKPLVDALERVIGPDDLVGVMTPEMSPTDIAFARKTTTIDGLLTRYWHWGERDRMVPPDPDDQGYAICYPTVPPAPSQCADQNGIAAEMIDRRHEKRSLDALQDLVRFLRGVREERKAVLAITDGWLQYRPNMALMRPLQCHGVPDQPQPGVDPRTRKLTANAQRQTPEGKCGVDRVHLAQIDDEREFREILDEANAANTSFYPIDPRGLAVFDTPIERQDVFGAPSATPTLSLQADSAMLRGRLTSLRTLAEATDGLAIVNSNDLAAGLKRAVDDLSSYYLLGYYSTGKLDGKFHSITVRVKRPGVQVRARRGFLAATPGAVDASLATAASAAPAKVDDELATVTAAVAPLGGYSRELPLRVQAATGWKPGDPPAPTVWIAGELGAGPEFADMWKGGAIATIELSATDGPSLASARATIAAGSRAFRVALAPSPPLVPGDYVVRVQARSTETTMPTRDTLHVTVPPQPQASGAIWIRRGPLTGNRDVPTADLRFRRSEQAKVEILTLSTDAGPARLLDQTGKALSVPVTAAVRNDADGSRWLTGQLALAPLGPGSYVIELSEGSHRLLAAFRVVP
jgi:VWFA-related protein